MIKFKTMTSLVVLAALSCGDKALAVLEGPFGETINNDPVMVTSFKAPSSKDDLELNKAARLRADAMVDISNKTTIEKGLLADIKAAFMVYYMNEWLEDGDLVGNLNSKKSSPLKAHLIAQRLTDIENFDVSSGGFDKYLKSLSKGHGALDPVKVDGILNDLADTSYIETLVGKLNKNRMAFLFFHTKHGLDELPGVTVSTSISKPTPYSPIISSPSKSSLPSAFEVYSMKKGDLQLKMKETQELEEKVLLETKLLEEEALKLEEEELRQAEEKLAQKKKLILEKKETTLKSIAQKKAKELESAYNSAVETVDLLDGTLKDMMKELGSVWKDGFTAVKSVSELVEQRELAAKLLLSRAHSVDKTEEATLLVNDTSRRELQIMALNSKAFLEHLRPFLTDPVRVPYEGHKNEELATVARQFCKAQSEVKKTEETLERLQSELNEAREMIEHVSAYERNMRELSEQKEKAQSKVLEEKKLLLPLEKEASESDKQIFGLEKYIKETSSQIQSLGMQLEQPREKSEKGSVEVQSPIKIQEELKKLQHSVEVTQGSLSNAQKKKNTLISEKLRPQQEKVDRAMEKVRSIESQMESISLESPKTEKSLEELRGDIESNIPSAIEEYKLRLVSGKEKVERAHEKLLYVNSQLFMESK